MKNYNNIIKNDNKNASQQIREELKNQVQKLCSLLQSLHPVETLKQIHWQFISESIGKTTESEMSNQEVYIRFFLEYLQNIFISIDVKDSLRVPNDEEWNKVRKSIQTIYQICLKTILHYNQSPDRFYRIPLFDFFVRGQRYPVHEYEHLYKLLQPHNKVLEELYQITAHNIAEGVKKLCYTTCISLQSVYKDLPPQEASDNSWKNIEKYLMDDKYFDVQKITGWPQNFIKTLSASVGSKKEFLREGKYPGTPLQNLPTRQYPFLEYNSKFYLFNPYGITDRFYRNIQSSVLKDKPKYLEKWNKRQKLVSENLPFQMLTDIIGQHKSIKNFQYKDGENWCECDGIILFEEWLFVIEIKSGKSSNKPIAQGITPHTESIKKLLIKPIEQGRRFIKILKNNSFVKLYDKKKNFIQNLSIKDFKKSIVMAVSLEQMTEVSSTVQQFKSFNLEQKGEAAWCISIDDLRAYRDIFQKKAIYFLHFLSERRKAFYNERLTLDDELDHLGMYLKYNKYHNITDDMPKSNFTVFAGFRDRIEEYFNLLFLFPKKIKKPSGYMPPILQSVIDNLEIKRNPGFTKTGGVICALSDKTKSDIEEGLSQAISKQNIDNKIRPCFLILETENGGLSTSFIIRTPNSFVNLDPKIYSIRNMFVQKKERALLLDISLDSNNKAQNVYFEWIKKSNFSKEEIKKYEIEAKQFSEFRFWNNKQSRTRKKIGRNETCPCGSGRKYKKCHLNKSLNL